jgi:hypothetical protein
MKKLKAILFHFLPNAAHYNFTATVRTVLSNAADIVKTALGDLLQDFINWNNKEFDSLEYLRKNVLTEKIAEVDHRLDRTLVALKAQVHALEYSLTTDIAEAAHRMSIMLSNYGEVYNKPYDEEMATSASSSRSSTTRIRPTSLRWASCHCVPSSTPPSRNFAPSLKNAVRKP